MRYRLQALGLLLLAALPLFSQSFRKVISHENETLWDAWIYPQMAGGFLVAETQHGNANNSPFSIARLSDDGNVEWVRKSSDRWGVSATSDQAGNTYITYQPFLSTLLGKLVVEKINANGQVEWQHQDNENGYSESPHCMTFRNGRLFLASTQGNKCRISAFDAASGSVVWTYLYQNTHSSQNDDVLQLIALQDGSLLVCTLSEYFTDNLLYRSILHLDASGNILTIRNFLGLAIEDVAELSNGNIVFSANRQRTLFNSLVNEDWFLGLMDADLNILWSKKVSIPNLSGISGVEPADNGDFLCVLQGAGDDCLGETMLFRADQQANIQWAKAIQGHFPIAQPKVTPDNGLIWGAVADSGLIVTRVDHLGDIESCPTKTKQPFALTDTTLKFVALPWGKFDAPPWSGFTPEEFVASNWQSSDYCTEEKLISDFTLSDDTVCLKEIVQAKALDSPGHSRWIFGLSGDQTISANVTVLTKTMAVAGLVPIQHVQWIGGCADTTTRLVLVNPPPSVDLGPDRQLCPGKALVLVGYAPTAISQQWSGGSTADSLAVNVQGVYVLSVNDGECTGADTVKVEMAAAPDIALGADQTVCIGESLLLEPSTSTGFDFLDWSDGSTGNVLRVESAGIYSLTATLGECTAADTVQVYFVECPPPMLFVPNAFAPDGQVENSRFVISAQSATVLSLSIFDRWGDQVFYTNTAPAAWDGYVRGRPAPVGVYAYMIRYQDVYGGKEMVKSGDVSLIR